MITRSAILNQYSYKPKMVETDCSPRRWAGTTGPPSEPLRRDKESSLVRLATLITTSGSRLHVRADDGGAGAVDDATPEGPCRRFLALLPAGAPAAARRPARRAPPGAGIAPPEGRPVQRPAATY